MQVPRRLPDDEINKITHLNAMRHFQYDPFAHIPREEATVGSATRSGAPRLGRQHQVGQASATRHAQRPGGRSG